MDEKIFRILPIENILSEYSLNKKNIGKTETGQRSNVVFKTGTVPPLTVTYAGGGDYRIVSGERQFRASVNAGMPSVPCFVINAAGKSQSVTSLSEISGRKKPNCFEQAEGISAMMKKLNLTSAEVSEKLGYSRSSVENKLMLLKIPKELRNYLIENGISERQSRALSFLKKEDCFVFAKYIAENKISPSETEKLIAEYLENKERKKRKAKIRGYCSDTRIYANSLNRILGIMKASGVSSGSKREEFEDKLVYTFVLNKEI